MQPIPALMLLAGGAALAAFPSADIAPQEPAPKPRILVVNDDGIESPGLAALVKALSGFADVEVCAPDGNRSGASQSIAGFGRPLHVKEVEMEGALRAYAIDGQPADATAYGLHTHGTLQPATGSRFALVVSGINAGTNLGSVSYYSGTIGAAREALFHQVPAVAVSAQRGADLEQAAAATAVFIERLLTYGPDAGVVYNVNLPAGIGPDTEWSATRMGDAEVRIVGVGDSQPQDDGWMVRMKLQRPIAHGAEGDLAAVIDEGKAAVVPLRFDATDDGERARLAAMLAGRD
jgi:5'-nucleotidase